MFLLVLTLLLFAYPAAAINRGQVVFPRAEVGLAVCPAIPLPSASPSEVLHKLQPFLDEAEKNISAALEADKSPGGVAVNVVYNDTVLWSKGFGLINESGMHLIS